VRAWTVLLLSLGAVFILSGCSDLGFYWQAASGHLDLLNRKQDIRELQNSPETSPELKQKLKLVESVRTFVIVEMALPDNEGYTGYVDLGRPYVTMVVTAAPPLELKSYQWCYWFAGCQEYRGYFDENDAHSYAAEMKQQELDVSVEPVTAYSTLGWLNKPWLPNYFSDPVLSTFLLQRDAELIATLIHEMAHLLRRDQVVAFLQGFVVAAFWFHPFVRILNRQLARAREEICDNYVLSCTDAPSYSRMLLRLAEMLGSSDPQPAAVGLFTSHWKLETRVAGILNEGRSRMTHLTMRSAKAQPSYLRRLSMSKSLLVVPVTMRAWWQNTGLNTASSIDKIKEQ